MDTRFWGPDGWKLLHSIAYKFPKNPNQKTKKIYSKFFNSLQHVLPCIYCRNSFAKYIKELPVENYLKNKTTFFKWMYDMHNKVNNKLKNQGLNKKTNPKLSEIKKFYKDYVNKNSFLKCNDAPGMIFIYSIIFNYPLNKDDFKTKTRIYQHKIFLKLLGELYPYEYFRNEYNSILKQTDFNKILQKRCLLKRWFYNIDKTLNEKCLSYNERCKLIELYRASCKKKTCMKKI